MATCFRTRQPGNPVETTCYQFAPILIPICSILLPTACVSFKKCLCILWPPPRPPATVDVRLNEVGDKVDIWWSEVRGWMIPNISSKPLSAGRVRHGLPDPPAAGPLGHGDGVGGAARPTPLPHPRQSRALRQLQVPRFYCIVGF